MSPAEPPAGSEAPALPLVELDGIVKSFPGVRANDGVSLTIEAGEVHGLLGENGAGKSTLMAILAGLIQPDEGSIRVRGEAVSFSSPREALARGIAIVQQHFSLVPTLSVAENVVLGAERQAMLRPRKLEARVKRLAETYRLDIDPRARIRELSVGERQRAEILKCLHRDPHVLILDEPTTVLTPAEVESLFRIVRSLSEQGRAVVFITHKLDELLEVSRRITVMRDGRVVSTVFTGAVDAPTLAHMMVGRDVTLRSVAAFVGLDEEAVAPGNGSSVTRTSGTPALSIKELTAHDDQGIARLSELNLDVFPGEILGLAGVEGNGQRELVEVLGGTRRPAGGRVELDGRDLTGAGPAELTAFGVRVVTEDRHETGVVLGMSVAENLVGDRIGRAPLSRWGVINRRAVRRTAADLMKRFGVRASGPDATMRTLSGGNQQRTVLARELSLPTKVLIAAQPTRGLDVGAIEEVTKRILAARDEGRAVLLISSDLAEVLALSDRVAVIHRGKILAVFDRAAATLENLAPLLAGIDGHHGVHDGEHTEPA